MRLGLVLPLANEETTLDDLLGRVLAQLAEEDGVFCVVDKASRDRTRERVAAWSVREPRVRLVWAPENRCVVDAYFRGYRAAYAAGCQWILEMDGGLSHLPEEIPQFLSAMAEGYDYVGGCRFIAGGSHRGSFKRYWLSRGGTLLTNWLLGTQRRDMTGGFECFSRPAMERVLSHGVRSLAHFFQTEIKFLMRDVRWKEVPITYRNPSKSVGARSLRDAIANLWQLYHSKRVSPAPEPVPVHSTEEMVAG